MLVNLKSATEFPALERNILGASPSHVPILRFYLSSLSDHPFVISIPAFDSETAETTVNILQVLLQGQGKNFCAGIDFSALNSISAIINVSCPGRAREALRRNILKWQVCQHRFNRLCYSYKYAACMQALICMSATK